MGKRKISLVLAILVIFSFFSPMAFAAPRTTLVATGNILTDGSVPATWPMPHPPIATWSLYSDGLLTVSGGRAIRGTLVSHHWLATVPAAHRNMIQEIRFDAPLKVAGFTNVMFAQPHVPNLSAITNLHYLDVSYVTNMSSMFTSQQSLTSIDGITNWDTSNVTDMFNMFNDTSSLESLDVNEWDTSNVTSMAQMFLNTSNLERLDLSEWNTSNVTTMAAMFANAHALTELDVSDWDTSSVTNMSGMFQNATILTELTGIADWATSNVMLMNSIFNGANSLESLDLSEWNTSNVTTMVAMFANAHELTELDVSDWDTSSVTAMNGMFVGTHELTELDVSDWDTSSVTGMDSMFMNAHALTELNVSDWDTSSVTNMNNIFNGASSLESLDLSSWDTNNVTSMENMFNATDSLFAITFGPEFIPASGATYSLYSGQWQHIDSHGVVQDVLYGAGLWDHLRTNVRSVPELWERYIPTPPPAPTPLPTPTPTPPSQPYELHLTYMIGDEHGAFRPTANITRAEVATILARTQLLDFAQDVQTLPPGMGSFEAFADVAPSDWHYYYIAWAYDAGLVQGFGGYFRPNDPITREEVAAMMARTETVLPAGDLSGFGDANAISDWARDYVYTAYQTGLMIGDAGLFRPNAHITRAEVATATNRTLGRVDSPAALEAITVANLPDARHFPDVSESAWYFSSVLGAANDHRLTRGVNGYIDWIEFVRN